MDGFLIVKQVISNYTCNLESNAVLRHYHNNQTINNQQIM